MNIAILDFDPGWIERTARDIMHGVPRPFFLYCMESAGDFLQFTREPVFRDIDVIIMEYNLPLLKPSEPRSNLAILRQRFPELVPQEEEWVIEDAGARLVFWMRLIESIRTPVIFYTLTEESSINPAFCDEEYRVALCSKQYADDALLRLLQHTRA